MHSCQISLSSPLGVLSGAAIRYEHAKCISELHRPGINMVSARFPPSLALVLKQDSPNTAAYRLLNSSPDVSRAAAFLISDAAKKHRSLL
jgi:hypothetical protein